MNLDDLLKNALADLGAANAAGELEAFRIKYLGAKGAFREAMDHLKSLPGPEKRGFGQRVNEIKTAVTAAFEGKKAAAESGPKVVTGIDVTTDKIAATSPDLGGRTEHLAADGAGHVFLNIQDRGTLLKLDARDLKVLNTWPLPGCGQPSSADSSRSPFLTAKWV